MARRKRVLDDGDDSDSSADSGGDDYGLDNDPDAREERALFDDPYKRKRKRNDGKDAAIYGIFAEDSDEEPRARPATRKKRKEPAFVQSAQKDKDVDMDGSEGEGEGEEDDLGVSDESEPSRPPSPRLRNDSEDNLPPAGGIGASRGGIGSSRGGIGSSGSAFNPAGHSPSPNPPKGGIGSQRATPPPSSTPNFTSNASRNFPSTFGSSKSTSFVRGAQPSAPHVLDPSEQMHFEKLSGSIGARLLSKMGWQAGAGLGVSGEGIVTPIETKMRPGRSGIAFRGFKEKTDQSKKEAKRRGEDVSDDETDKKAKRKERAAKEKRADVWKNPKKVKTRVEHKTYEEILADAGDVAMSGIGQIIDATGAVPREVSSLADISLNTWSPSNDPTRIPEVRHNIRLIHDACKSDLDGLAREAKILDEKKNWIIKEDLRLRKKVEQEAELIARLQRIQLVSGEIQGKARELETNYEPALQDFNPYFDKLMNEFEKEFTRYRLDEVVVAAIAPVIRRLLQQWDPLENPTFLVDILQNWRLALPVTRPEKPETQVDVYGTQTYRTPAVQEVKPMTPFESLLWNIWLPKVRSAINNEWSAHKPDPAIRLYEAWSTFLPPFISDNILDQLILPKVQKAVSDWSPRLDEASLQAIVFPWLPYVGLRLDDLLGEARRKVKSILRHWSIGDQVPKDLAAWKNVFGAKDWDELLLKNVVPKLGATLRNDFRVNPRQQNMEPLTAVLQWAPILRPSFMAQLLEEEFFPKWLDVLHIWLIQPKVSFEEVAQWYTFWKSAVAVQGSERGFTRGLQLMNRAIELGADAPKRLAKPDFRAEISPAPKAPVGVPKAKIAARTQEITFKSIVEEYAASHNLLVIPTGKAHEKSRMPLFRVSSSVDGRGGLVVFILDDAVWAAVEGMGGPTEDFVAISLETMVVRANSA